jgi:hypothetical protein
MPITFRCSCGKTLQVKDEFAGRRVKCPACSGVAVVPAAMPAFEVVEDEPPAPPPPPKSRPVAAPVAARKATADDDAGFDVVDDEDDRPRKKVRARARDDDDEDDDDRPRRKVKARSQVDEEERSLDNDKARYLGVDDDEDEDDRPRKKKRKSKKKKDDHLAFEKAILNSGIPGGVAAMVVATIWFIVAIMNDWIFWYPPILFCVGLAAVIKALVNPNEGKDD